MFWYDVIKMYFCEVVILKSQNNTTVVGEIRRTLTFYAGHKTSTLSRL